VDLLKRLGDAVIEGNIQGIEKRMMACIIGAEMRPGRGAWCVKYLKAYRENKIEVWLSKSVGAFSNEQSNKEGDIGRQDQFLHR
jgi:hypothetical protein